MLPTNCIATNLVGKVYRSLSFARAPHGPMAMPQGAPRMPNNVLKISPCWVIIQGSEKLKAKLINLLVYPNRHRKMRKLS